jgi:hypothetical protein
MLIKHVSDPQCQGTNQCPPGVEFGEYSFDPATGALTLFNMLYDTNGCDGAFETCAAGSNNTSTTVTVTVAPDGLTATLIDRQGTSNALFRISPQ